MRPAGYYVSCVESSSYREAMMTARAPVWLSIASCVLSLTLTALSLLLVSLNLTQPGGQAFGHWAENTILAIGFSVVGAVIVLYGPSQNPIGWLFCATGLIWAVVHFCAEYALYTMLTAPGALPGGEVAAGLFVWLWAPELGIVAVAGLFFPDGRLPGRRWRWARAALPAPYICQRRPECGRLRTDQRRSSH